MEPAEFLLLIQGVYRRLLNGVEGLQRQSTIVVEVLAAVGYAFFSFLCDVFGS